MLVLGELGDRALHVARVGDQDVERAGAHAQQAAGDEGEDVIERQGADDGELAGEVLALEPRLHPRLRRQQVGDDGVMQQRRALGDAGRAAGVLQHRHVAGADVGTREGHRTAGRYGVVEFGVTGQREGRHHLAHGAHDEVDDQALGKAQKVAHRGDDDVLHRGAAPSPACSVAGEVLQHDHGLGAGVLQLMGELARGVERIDVDGDQAGAQHGGQRHRILQHVGHHDRHARALREAPVLQPGGQRLGQRVDVAEGDGLVHADIGALIAELGEALLEQRHDAGIDRRIDVRRHSWRIAFQPEPIHAFPRSCVEPTIAMSGCERFHVITGGPGSGKTSLIDGAGARRTTRARVEAGRAIIQDQLAIDGPPCRGAIHGRRVMLSWECGPTAWPRRRPVRSSSTAA